MNDKVNSRNGSKRLAQFWRCVVSNPIILPPIFFRLHWEGEHFNAKVSRSFVFLLQPLILKLINLFSWKIFQYCHSWRCIKTSYPHNLAYSELVSFYVTMSWNEINYKLTEIQQGRIAATQFFFQNQTQNIGFMFPIWVPKSVCKVPELL